jgi:hypothetical protein
MADEITDVSDASDLKVFEGGSTTDGYSVYVSDDWDGPWIGLGTGMGTAEFDLADGSVESARYVKLVDDGTGSPSETNPGVDIDAVQNLAAVIPNQPPNTPVMPVGPNSGTVDVEYSYTTSTTDPELQQISYLWSWGDMNSSWLGPFDSGAVATATHFWSVAGNYTVKVKAKDVLGMESAWSGPITVHIEMSLPVEIGEVTGGFGRVTAEVKNTGTDELSNISWSILLDDGLVLLGRDTSGSITEIQPGLSTQIQTRFLFCFGKITIMVTADVAKKTISAFLFGPLVIIKK